MISPSGIEIYTNTFESEDNIKCLLFFKLKVLSNAKLVVPLSRTRFVETESFKTTGRIILPFSRNIGIAFEGIIVLFSCFFMSDCWDRVVHEKKKINKTVIDN